MKRIYKINLTQEEWEYIYHILQTEEFKLQCVWREGLNDGAKTLINSKLKVVKSLLKKLK